MWDRCRSGASAASGTPLQVKGADSPLQVKGAIKGGALDYEYRKKNLLHPWVIIDDFCLPIFILAFGFWCSIETLKQAFVSPFSMNNLAHRSAVHAADVISIRAHKHLLLQDTYVQISRPLQADLLAAFGLPLLL